MDYKVLIVEDDIISANYLKSIVEKESSYKVVSIVTNTNEAKNIIQNSKIDIAFIDIMLENSNGIDLANYINENYKDIIIIFLTALSDKDTICKAVNANASSYLVKPFTVTEIYTALMIAQNKLNKIKPIILNLINNFYFDFSKRKLYRKGKEINLSKEELKLVEILCKNYNLTLDSNILSEQLNISYDALRALIYRIRQITSKNLIKSQRNFGYKINSL